MKPGENFGLVWGHNRAVDPQFDSRQLDSASSPESSTSLIFLLWIFLGKNSEHLKEMFAIICTTTLSSRIDMCFSKIKGNVGMSHTETQHTHTILHKCVFREYMLLYVWQTNINPKHLLVTYWYYKNCILTICFFKYQKRIGLSRSISKF